MKNFVLCALFLLTVSVFGAQTAPPVFTLGPNGGFFSSNTSTTVTDSTPGAVITWGFVTNGTCTPNTAYTSAINISPAVQVVLCATAIATGFTTSNQTTAQYIRGATGNGWIVSQPSFPGTFCAKIPATRYIVSTTAKNVDPWNATSSPSGALITSGGTDYQPSATYPSYSSAEASANVTADTSAIQNALNSCPSGQAVEIIPATGPSGTYYGMIIKSINIPSGVTLSPDAGIVLFASLSLSDWSGTNCGTVASSSSCSTNLINVNGSNSGIYGYGTIDGRGWDKFNTTSANSISWYTNRVQAYANSTTGGCGGGNRPIGGYPSCSQTSAGGQAYGPTLLRLNGATNFIMYGITLKDPGGFNVNWTGSGFLAYNVKLISNFFVPNTDSWDPLNATNGTFAYSFISGGDNKCALKSSGSLTSNISYIGMHDYAGVGCVIGTQIQQGISNFLVFNQVSSGNLYNYGSQGFGLGSSHANGGPSGTPADLITFAGVCSKNEYDSIKLWTNAFGGSGSTTPQFTNVGIHDVHVLSSTAPWTIGNSGYFTFQGLNSSNSIGPLTLNDVLIDGTNQGGNSKDGGSSTYQNVNVVYGPGYVDSSLVTNFAAGTNINVTGSPATSVKWQTDPCAATTSNPGSPFQPIIGDLFLRNATLNNQQSITSPGPTASVTVVVSIRPATAVNIKEASALGQPITFLRNGSPLTPTVTLTSNGTLATFTDTVGPGTYTYSAKYPTDSNYAGFTPYNFGSATFTVTGTGTVPFGQVGAFLVGP